MRTLLLVVVTLTLTGCSTWLPPGPEQTTAAQREAEIAAAIEKAGLTAQAVSPALPPPWNLALLGLGAVAAGAAAAWRQSVGRHQGWEEKEQDLAKDLVTDLAKEEAKS